MDQDNKSQDNSQDNSRKNKTAGISKVLTPAGLATIIIFIIILSLGSIKFYYAIPSIKDLVSHPLKAPVTVEIKSFETGYSNNFESLQKKAVDLIGNTEKAVGKRVMETNVMTLAFDTQGNLHRIMPETDITENLNSLKDSMTYLKSRNVKSVFVLVPSSVVEGKTVLPPGVSDYQNLTGDKVISELTAANINTVDLRKEFVNNNVDLQDVFFNTDHHWKIPYAYMAAKITSGYLNKTYNFGLDPDNVFSDYKNYEVTTHSGTFAGSYTAAAGESFVGPPDDFTTVLPKYETSFRFRSYEAGGTLQKTIAGRIMDYKGPFSTALFDGRPVYTGYLNGGLTHLVIDNYLSKNNLTCMVVGTSHSRSTSAFLAPYFKQLIFIDMQGGRFKKNLYSYIDTVKPDVVVYMYAGFTFTLSEPFSYAK